MVRRFKNSLQRKVFIGLALLLIAASSTIYYLNQLTAANHASLQLLGQVYQLDVQGKAIQRRAMTYSRYAPRDYGPYERDLIIFYPDFIHDLDAFEKKITQVDQFARSFQQHLVHAGSYQALIHSTEDLQGSWTKFRQGFQDKLGDNPAEPRLEWGADYVDANQELINNITGMLISSIESAIQNQLEKNEQLSVIAVTAMGILLVLAFIWFYLSVLRRIAGTVAGCHRVAQGDFGYQLPVTRQDELGSLATAFNTLSARTRFVLTMLSKMHSHTNVENKLDSMKNEAAGYLPVELLGLWQFDPANNQLDALGLRSERNLRSQVQETLVKAATKDPHLLSLIRQNKPLRYDNLDDIVSKTPNAAFMREVLKIGLLKSALIVPLAADDGWQGLLVFITSDEAAYTEEQLELLGNLSPFMANGFAQAAKD